MSRKIGENKIEVSSNDNNVPSGKYATKASKISAIPARIRRTSLLFKADNIFSPLCLSVRGFHEYGYQKAPKL